MGRLQRTSGDVQRWMAVAAPCCGDLRRARPAYKKGSCHHGGLGLMMCLQQPIHGSENP